jgi:diacylglycerol kinase family enzyme
MRYVGVFNRDGGTFRTMDLDAFCAEATTLLAEHGHSFDCRVVAGKDVAKALLEAARSGAVDVLLAGGGDGTISSAAEVAFGAGVPLAVLPAGTMNLFARALGIPLDLRAALVTLASGELASVDIATANGRPFIHQFGVGIHARLVRIRAGMIYRSRWGKMLASLRAIASAIVNPPRFETTIRTKSGSETRHVSGVSVSNNILGEGHTPYADKLDDGVLGVYIARPMSAFALAALAAGILVGRWKTHPMVSEMEAEEVTLRFPKRKSGAQAVVDGELIRLDREVILRIHPLALKVIIPRAAEKTAAAA